MSRTVAVVLVMSLLCATTAAAQPGEPEPEPAAQPAPAPAPPPPPPRYPTPPPNWEAPPLPVMTPTVRVRRYPMKLAAVDALSAGAILVGTVLVVSQIDGGSEGNATVGVVLLVGGALGITIGSPLVHLNEDNSPSAWKALALRLGIPLVLGALSSSRQNSDGTSSSNGTLESLATLLYLGGIVVDYAVLAKVEIADEVPMMPYVAPLRGGGVSLGLGGSF